MNFAPIFALLSSKISRFFIFAALAAPFVVNPTMFFPFVAGKAIFFRLMVEGALLFFLITVIANPRAAAKRIGNIWREPLVVAISIFTALFIFAGIVGVAPQYSFFSNFERGEGGFALLHLYIFFLLLLINFPTRKDWLSLLKFSLFISVLIGFYAIAQKAGPDSALGKFVIGHSQGEFGRPSGTLGNPSYISVYSMFHLLFAFFVLYYERIQWQKIIWLFAAVLNIYSIFWSQTRGTLLGLGVAFLLGLIMLSFAPAQKKDGAKKLGLIGILTDFRWLSRIFLIGVIIFGAFFLTTRAKFEFWSQIPGVSRFIGVSLTEPFKDSAFQSRYWTWTSAFKGFYERPVLGWGPENFPQAFDKYYNPLRYGSESWFDRAHNVIFDYLVSGGVLLFGAYVGIFVVFYLSIIRRRKESGGEKRHDFLRQPYALLVLFATLPIAYLIQNLFLFDVLAIYIVLYTFFAFSIQIVRRFELVPEADPKDFSEGFSSGRVVVAGLAVVLIGALAYTTGYLPYKKNMMIREAMAITGQNPLQGMLAFERAIQFYSPVGQPETIEQAAAAGLGIFTNYLRQQKNLIPEAEAPTIDFLNVVYEKAKEGGFVLGAKPIYLYAVANLQAAVVFRDARYFVTARKLFESGHAFSPTRLEFIFGLLDISLQTRDKVLGLEMVQKGRALRPDLEEDFVQYEQILGTF